MKTSVIIVSYNVSTLLQQCLESLSGAYEVIVVDNASSDGSVELVRMHFPNVKLIASPENRGFSWAVNQGAKVATGDIFLILNPDTQLSSGGITRMEQALAAYQDAWAMGFRQVDDAGNFQLAIGLEPSIVTELLRRFVQRRLDRGAHWLGKLLDSVLIDTVSVPWVAGSSLLVYRHAFERIGGFDERYFLFFEDIDFCLRLRKSGGRIYYNPYVTLLHHRGQSAKKSAGIAARAYRESQLLFWQEHRGKYYRLLIQCYLRLRGLMPGQH